MVCLQKNSLPLFLAIFALLLRIPGSYSEPDVETNEVPEDQEDSITDMLASLPEPYNKVTIKQTFDAQVGDSCNEEGWKLLTKPFWEQNFNKDISASEEIYIKAHTGWIENPEFAGRSCFNNRHIRSGKDQIYPAMPLMCVSGKCVCYKGVLGSRKFKLRQIEIKYQGPDSTNEDDLADCVGDVGSNCNRLLFPCDPKYICQSQENGQYECVSKKPLPAVSKKVGKKVNPSVKKELQKEKVVAVIKEKIPGVNTAARSVISGVTIISVAMIVSRLA